MAHFFERLELVENLKNVYDLERLAGRVACSNVNARDLIQCVIRYIRSLVFARHCCQ